MSWSLMSTSMQDSQTKNALGCVKILTRTSQNDVPVFFCAQMS